MRVIIVETDSEIIKEVKSVLKKYEPDWELIVIESGIQCLSLIKELNCPVLVITGMQLTDMSGFELTENLRDDSGIPVIVISRDKDINALVRAFDVGAHDYIESPFNKVVFIARIKAKIRRFKWDNNIQKGNLTNIDNPRVMCHSISGKSEC